MLVKVGDWVLPISTTSGVLLASGSAVVILVTRSPQPCSSILRVAPVLVLKVSFKYVRSSSGVSPPASHRVMVLSALPAGSLAAAEPVDTGAEDAAGAPLPPQAVRESAAAVVRAASPRYFFIGDPFGG